VSGGPAMSSRWGLAALSAMLALAGCVQAATGQAAPKMPPPMEKTGNVPEHGGGDGGGGGAGM
jgi:hypothetical protein